MKKSLAFPLFFSMTLIFRSVSGQLVDIAPGLLTPGQDGASEWEVWNEPSQEGRVDTTRDVPDRGAYEQANSGQYQYPAGLQQQYGQPQAPAQAPQAGLADIAWNYPQQAANPAQPYNPAPAQNIQPQLQPAPAQSIQPEQPVQSIQHEQPAQSIQPQQPVQSIQPQQPVQSIQPQQPVQSIQPQQPVQSIQPQQPVQSIQPQQPVQSIQPQQPAQSLQPQQPFQSNQPQQPEQSIQPQQPVQSIQPNEQSAPAQGSQPDQQSYQTAAPNSPVQVNQVLNPSDRVNLPAQQPVVVNIHLPSQKDDSDEEEYEDDEDYEDEEEYEDEDYEYDDEEEDYESSGDEDEDGWEDSSSSREHDAQKVVPKKKMRVYRVRLQKQWNPHMLAVVYSLFVTAAFILFIGLCLSYNRDRVSRWILRRKHGYTHVPVKEESKKLLSDTIADL